MRSRARPAPVKVIHLSSSHYADDIRIFWKECLGLSRAGYDVTFVVASDRKPAREGVNVVGVKRRSGRLGRLLATPLDVLRVGLQRQGRIYHFHDPELIPVGLLLRALGKQVIYDAHEDLPRDILLKEWIPRILRRPLAFSAAALEWIAAQALSGVVAATPAIAQRFPRAHTALVQNFALKSEFVGDRGIARGPRRAVAYVGGITADRCAFELVNAMARIERFPDVSLIVAGIAEPTSLIKSLSALPGWSRVEYRGLQDRDGVRRALAEARAGLVLLRPVQSFIESQPVKLFEYMAAGLPVIASDFPRFREIIEGNRCGFCLPPHDVTAIASAIEWVFEHEAEAEEMGARGRELVMHRFNWEHEEQELRRLYEQIITRH